MSPSQALQKKNQTFLLGLGVLASLAFVIYRVGGTKAALVYLSLLVVLELLTFLVVKKIGVPFGTHVMERLPRFPDKVIQKFATSSYDSELGWVRKPGTSKIEFGKPYHIDTAGSRVNTGHEHLPAMISTYGDSYTFGRECGDQETWQWHLAERLGVNVLNFGVGNYGLDQALLRLKREYPKSPTPFVIMGVVPDTLARILSIWKHFREYGNTLAFKPRFTLQDGQLRLVPNPISHPEKLRDLNSLMENFEQHDYFYPSFIQDSSRFPFLISSVFCYRQMALLGLKIRRMAFRFVGSQANEAEEERLDRLRSFGASKLLRLYTDEKNVALMEALIDEFVHYGERQGFQPALIFMPMKEDLRILRSHPYYRPLIQRLRGKLPVLDLGEILSEGSHPDLLFARWHYSPLGNLAVAREVGRFYEKVYSNQSSTAISEATIL